MIEYPKRTVQHQNEYESMAVLLYHLRKKGILRSFRELDYGIDLEYEFVHNDTVTGKSIKIQLKSSNNLKIDSDGTPKIYNIKQSTLNYWAEISYRTNVILVAVDLSNERIYCSRPLFWEIIKKIDPTRKDKHISLIGGDPFTNEITCALIDSFALAPVIHEIILNQKIALQYLEEILQFCYEITFHDQFLEVEDTSILKNILDICSILLWNVDVGSHFNDFKRSNNWNKISFFYENSKDGTLKYCYLYKSLEILINLLLKKLIQIRNSVLDSFSYWVVHDKDYIEMVYQYDIEQIYDKSLKEILVKYSGDKRNYLKNHSDIINYFDNEINKFSKLYNLKI
jgi:predicted transcriptional regulator